MSHNVSEFEALSRVSQVGKKAAIWRRNDHIQIVCEHSRFSSTDSLNTESGGNMVFSVEIYATKRA
jgi:hypothetical protein